MNGCSIFVISMPGATERRAAFAAGASAASSAWSFVDALTAAPPGLEYSRTGAITKIGRPLEPGEIGCFASHWRVWNEVADSNRPAAIVLEDDTLVDWSALDAIAAVEFAPLGLDLVRLYSTHPFKHRVVIHRFLGAHSHLVRVSGMFFGTQGYVVTRRAARRLVMLARSIAMPVDWFMGRYWEFGFKNYCLFPFPIMERFSPSVIGERAGRYSMSSGEWLRRQASRIADRAARFMVDCAPADEGRFGPLEDAGASYIERTGPPPSTGVPREGYRPDCGVIVDPAKEIVGTPVNQLR